ncbi:MAG: ribonuclease HII [Treponema sp.]|nr:ribonuclease HII [Treponema sp.]
MELICGLDEAGRGPLAGPVVAGAVILPETFPLELLNDSKKLSEKKRMLAYNMIKEKACWGLGIVSHKEIDEMNILKASLFAMKIAFENMIKTFDKWKEKQGINDFSILAIADGNFIPDVSCKCECRVKADATFPSVMAASILAKVERDLIMTEMDKLYPEYGYKKHKGYPTKAHRDVCKRLGPSPIQRLTFSYEK